MSPARSKRQAVPHRRTRSDIVKAVAVAAAIVAATSLLVWLLRPGPAGIPGTGGLMNRQPRSSWLVATAIGVAASAIWWILRHGRRARSRARILIPTALVVVALGTVGAGIAWPGGLLRHDIAPAPEPTPTTAPKTTPTTANPRSSTTIARSSTSAGPSTSSPTTTGPAGTGPTGTTPLRSATGSR